MSDGLCGIIDFSPALFCWRDALGQTVDISIGRETGILVLPSLPEWLGSDEDPLQD